MEKLGIVLLNYLNYDDTIECLKTIRKQTIYDIPVVIVDNYSQNASIDNIRRYIETDKNTYLLESQSNMGYAKGNNLGINFLREQLNISNILVCNNDVLFIQPNYLENLLRIKVSNNIGAIGTKIQGSDNRNQNPCYEVVTKERLKKIIRNSKIRKYVFKDKKHWEMLKKILKRENIIDQRNEIKEFSQPTILEGNLFLHGSVILLTKNYLNLYDGFYPETFLYFEEHILKILMDKKGLKMLYLPDEVIYHKEDQSSALSFDNDSYIMDDYNIASKKIALSLIDLSYEDIKKKIDTYPLC